MDADAGNITKCIIYIIHTISTTSYIIFFCNELPQVSQKPPLSEAVESNSVEPNTSSNERKMTVLPL